jgi:predicted Zn-dependent protease
MYILGYTYTRNPVNTSEVYLYKNIDASKRYTIALHELGHLLGLPHSDQENDIMYYKIGNQKELTDNDIARIRELYK